MLATIESRSFRLGPRTELRPGDRFRVGGGPTYRGEQCGLRGLFEFARTETRGRRTWVWAWRISDGQRNGIRCLYAAGRPYNHPLIPGWRCRPYTIRRSAR